MFEKETGWLLQEKYQGRECEAFSADLKRLKTGEPLAYVIGHILFLNMNIDLSSKPLIPRTETEFWVEKAIEAIKSKSSLSPIRILDLCAGSGCIGVSIANTISESIVDFVEIDSNHLSTIKTNCRNNNVDLNRVNILQSNLFESLSEQEKYDYIITNPPYIDPDLNRTENSVQSFEPKIALYGGQGGMDIIASIINKASNYLKPQGEIWIEHEPEQTKAIWFLAKSQYKAKTQIDQYGAERFTQLMLQ